MLHAMTSRFRPFVAALAASSRTTEHNTPHTHHFFIVTLLPETTWGHWPSPRPHGMPASQAYKGLPRGRPRGLDVETRRDGGVR